METTAARLLHWYDHHRRILPWRAPLGRRADPYQVWLSEIMLQQTTVVSVIPYYRAFLDRWPTVAELARAPLDDVLHAWQGLGYYARARNLHACARAVAARPGGRFPDTEAGLRALPGVGDYTAAAIAAIAFNRPAAAVDGNVVRVITRLAALAEPLPGVRAAVRRVVEGMVPALRPGDFAQAMMDLGATVCTPRRPNCPACPWAGDCAAHGAGTPTAFPVKAPRKARPDRHGVAFWLTRPDGALLLRRRPEKGLLGGLVEVPTTDWRDTPWSRAEAIAQAPVKLRGKAAWTPLDGQVVHVFTHFRLTLDVWTARLPDAGPNLAPATGFWWPADRLGEQALPTLMRKVADLAKMAGG